MIGYVWYAISLRAGAECNLPGSVGLRPHRFWLLGIYCELVAFKYVTLAQMNAAPMG